MPPEPTGTVYATRHGYGIRWPEDGRKNRRTGFATKTEARRWYAENVAPRLGRKRPSPEITFDAFVDVFLKRHGATVAPATKRTLEERLAPARDVFGEWTLRELEGAADDVAAWRAGLGEGSRYRLTSAFRQALGAAVRWGYIVRNPAAAWEAVEALPPRLDTPLLFPASEGGPIGLDTWRTREWYPALEAAGIAKRGPYHLRHTFATEALAAGVSTFELARLMGTSLAMIDRTYGHLARDSEESIRERLDARAARSDHVRTTAGEGEADG